MNRPMRIGTGKKLRSIIAELLSMFLLLSAITWAQTSETGSTVPTLVNFNGTVTDGNGHPLSGVHGVTFFLYKDSDGGSPLWMETQNVQADSRGHYSVMLRDRMKAGVAGLHDPGKKPTLASPSSAQLSIHAVDSAY